MRTEFLCSSVLRVASGPRVKMASCKSALTPPTPRWFTLLTVLRRWSHCYSLLLCGLFYEAICFMSYLVSFCSCVFQSLALRLPRLGKRELILVLFVCLIDLCLFGFVGFLFLLFTLGVIFFDFLESLLK